MNRQKEWEEMMEEKLDGMRRMLALTRIYPMVSEHCSCCGRDILFGNACAEISRLVEQMEHDVENPDGITTVIDSAPLVTLCASCANETVNIHRLREKLREEMGIHEAKDSGCDACEVAQEDGARVSITLMIGQTEWSMELDGSEVIPLYSEELLWFCHRCGNKFSEARVRNAVNAVLCVDLTDDEK